MRETETSTPPVVIEYLFRLTDGTEKVFPFCFDPQTMELLPDPTLLTPPPDWTALDWHQCDDCPLESATHPHCPAALAIRPIVERCDRLISYDTLTLQVLTADRTVLQETTAQKALCSLLGLVLATSGCPRLAFFRPMARFHLPLANESETIFRAAASYMLCQYFAHQRGDSADLQLEGLKHLYQAMQKVNLGMAQRLRTTCRTDSTINAIILLDMYAKGMPHAIRKSLDELASLFAPFLDTFLPEPDHHPLPAGTKVLKHS